MTPGVNWANMGNNDFSVRTTVIWAQNGRFEPPHLVPKNDAYMRTPVNISMTNTQVFIQGLLEQ